MNTKTKNTKQTGLESLHPEALVMLFGRGLLASDAKLEANIGRAVRFARKWTPKEGTQVRDNDFRIIGVQKDWKGVVCYRIVCDAEGDTFGRVAYPKDWKFVDAKSSRPKSSRPKSSRHRSFGQRFITPVR